MSSSKFEYTFRILLDVIFSVDTLRFHFEKIVFEKSQIQRVLSSSFMSYYFNLNFHFLLSHSDAIYVKVTH